jgi:hypothetical protein
MSSLQEKISTAILARIRKQAEPTATASARTALSPVPARIREAKFSDFEAIVRLKERGGLSADSIENWNRLWHQNPALSERSGGQPMGWVLEAGEAIVGYLGNIPLKCRYGSRSLTAVSSHAFVVDPPYRALALSLASAFYRQKSPDLIIASTAIQATGVMAVAFKCAALPQPEYDTVLFWVLRPRQFGRILVTKLHLKPWLARIGSTFLAIAISIDKIVRRRWPKGAPSKLTVKEGTIEAIGSDIDELLSEKFKEGNRLLADRSAEVLRWHFTVPGDRGSVRLLRCYENESLKGYAVVRSDTDENGLRKSILADLIARRDDASVVAALWAAAYRHAKDEGRDVLEVQGFPSSIRGVSNAWGPYRRKVPACPYYYRATDPELHRTLSDPSAWYACPFDGDATLIRASYSSPSSPNVERPIVTLRDQEDCSVGIAKARHTEGV